LESEDTVDGVSKVVDENVWQKTVHVPIPDMARFIKIIFLKECVM
jgi:hypothetical protein